MRRIGLAVALAVSLTLAPVAAEAQQQQVGKVYRVGWLTASATAGSQLAAAFRLGLRERGYGGQLQRLPELVAELVRLRGDTIFVNGDQAIKAAEDATSTIPIVMLACDARGITCISSEIAGKRLELLRQMLSRAGRIAVIYSRDDPGKAPFSSYRVNRNCARIEFPISDLNGGTHVRGNPQLRLS
jgi:putative tryptophan/tyrosine transport system substrate-binding protein